MRLRALLLLLLTLGGCASQGTREPVTSTSSGLEVELAKYGPWKDAARPSPFVATSARAPTLEPLPPTANRAPVRAAPTPPPVPAAPPIPVPAARGTGETAKKGAPPVKPLAAVARERFLDHPTEVRADSLTLVLPPRLLAEARLTGADVSDPAPGRRVAAGGARLVCRELTLVGERITLRTRTDGTEDVQVTARGNVDFVSRRHDHVERHQALRTLILTNDTITPLP